jgi:WD40 repeat protein
VTASEDNTARLWDTSTGRELHVLQGHEAPVYHAAFSPDGRTVVTASGDNTARLWDAGSGMELQVLRGHEAPVNHTDFSPDGRTLVTASNDGTARLWQCIVCYPLQDLLKLAEERQSRPLTNQEHQRYLP